ncbi:MAG: hypothetical protein K8S14_03125 [Actinomycetia bacterium]|nr:hypothetical protein [Actinomycetes bacterium]
MRTFKTYFKKEILEAIRTNKYLILFVGTIFWALLNPLVLKLVPLLLKSSPVDMTSFLPDFTRDVAFQSFMGDFFQIGTLFFAFTLMGLLSNEVRFKKLVLPYTGGADPAGIVLAKYIHYGATLSIFILTAFLTNYFYTDQLFDGGILSVGMALRSALLYILYYCVLLAILLYLSSLFKRGLAAGIAVVVMGYTLSVFNKFSNIRPYLPNYLLYKAADIGNALDNTLIPTLIISFCLIIVFVLLTVRRMKKIDIA